VTLEIDAYPDRTIRGHVASVQPGSGTAFSVLPAENATGNCVKIVQRVPVKIIIVCTPTCLRITVKVYKAGGPDFMLIPPVGQLHCLEVKRLGEDLSNPQEEFQLWCIRHCVPHSVVFTLDEALALLDGWGCLRIKMGGAR
jgi:hypothetical protein